MKLNTVYNMDCIDGMKELIDNGYTGYFDFIEIDPPYNIGKDSWDKFSSQEEYLKFIREVLSLSITLMNANGSLFLWHNDILIINDYINIIKEIAPIMKLKQLCIWNKYFRQDEQGVNNKHFGFLNGFIQSDMNRNYQKMCEYVLYYTKQDELEDEYSEEDSLKEIKDYFLKAQKESKLNTNKINIMLGHRNSEHTFYKKKQWQIPTEESYKELQGIMNLPLSYPELLEWYNNLRYTYNSSNNNWRSSIWNYPIDKQTKHKTEKPLMLYYDLLNVHTKPKSKCLFPFVGSGNNILSLLYLNRDDNGVREYIGFEKSEKWYNIIQERCVNNAIQ